MVPEGELRLAETADRSEMQADPLPMRRAAFSTDESAVRDE